MKTDEGGYVLFTISTNVADNVLPGIAELVRESYRRGYLVALASVKNNQSVDNLITIADQFDVIYGPDDSVEGDIAFKVINPQATQFVP